MAKINVHAEDIEIKQNKVTVIDGYVSDEEYPSAKAVYDFASQNGKINKVKRNGSELPIVDKTVDIAVPEKISDLENDSDFVTSGDLDTEATLREEADANLQEQIDGITSASDVVDVVGTKAELDNYDTSKLGNNDIVKVLQDETKDNAITYYRWLKTSSQWQYIGSQGPFYTKGESDEKFVEKETGKGLSTNDFTNAEKTKLETLKPKNITSITDDVLNGGIYNLTQEFGFTYEDITVELLGIIKVAKIDNDVFLCGIDMNLLIPCTITNPATDGTAETIVLGISNETISNYVHDTEVIVRRDSLSPSAFSFRINSEDNQDCIINFSNLDLRVADIKNASTKQMVVTYDDDTTETFDVVIKQ